MDDKKLHNLTDDGLETLFKEIQLILNERRLTRVITDASDLCALTRSSKQGFPKVTEPKFKKKFDFKNNKLLKHI